MIPRAAWGPLALGAFGALLGLRGLIGYLFTTRPLHGLIAPALTVAACVLVTTWVGRQGIGSAVRNLSPGNGYGRSLATRHENGHAKVARALGCSVRFIRDEHGVPIATEVVSGPRLTDIQEAAIDLGGWAAAGSRGTGDDWSHAKARFAGLSVAERDRRMAEAWKLAKRYA